ncbi:uncharacterized protein EAF01_000454 [Botrytis porri]|uniref:Uncharacterized protein n=1 Tax=Botrytis porri TaxID=87229 RepID=A0A4Z1KM32_9HELO|nr:uncharacterized protein EAF01_000454 [Botrytis porri]KAF7914048.1 hypothetical protein EAF01_000454 [Botrytis porri]TGO86540.1 hypothetical protein BPOR_0294g00020 [Botrytis porri]
MIKKYNHNGQSTFHLLIKLVPTLEQRLLPGCIIPVSKRFRQATPKSQFSSFAEQRDMHSVMENIMSRQESLEDKVDNKFTKMFQELCELKAAMVTAQALNSSAQVLMHEQLSQLQLMSFINNLSLDVTLDPTKSLQIYFFARKRQHTRQAEGSAFWLAPKMQNWNSSIESSLLMVKGSHRLRNDMKKFSADAIQLLRESSMPVIWALKTIPMGNTTTILPKVSYSKP